MEPKNTIKARVISPAKDRQKRVAKGFSLLEIKESGKSIEDLRENNLNIDYFRRSSHKENIEHLKNLKPSSKTKKKREPFTFKEKKRTSFKAAVEKPEISLEKPTKSPKVKEAKAKPKKEKAKRAVKKEEAAQKGTPLSSLSGLGPATVSKFKELGVETVEQLIEEDPDELAALIKGVSKDRIKKWIEEGKGLLI